MSRASPAVMPPCAAGAGAAGAGAGGAGGADAARASRPAGTPQARPPGRRGRPGRRRRRAARSRASARAGSVTSSPRSSSTSTAGSTIITPSSETDRSTTVTTPKSRSILMPDSISTAKPAIAVDARGHHRPPGGGVGDRQRRGRVAAGLPLLAVALGQQHAELGGDGDHQRAQRDRHRVEGDAHREQHQRRPPAGQRDRDQRHQRPPGPPVHGQQHQRDGQQGQHHRCQAPPVRRHLRVGLGGQHGQADQLGADPRRGGLAAAERISSITSCWRSSGIRRMPNDIVARFWRRLNTAWAKYGGTESSRAAVRSRLTRGGGLRTGWSATAPGTARPGRTRSRRSLLTSR